MKIGFLHSVKLNLGSIANAKMYRIMYEDWKDDIIYWMEACYYGRYTNRAHLRGLIYNYRRYYEEFADVNDYDLIALSLNFDTYPDDFHKFVQYVINDLYTKFPILHQKEVIILAGNEVFEKRGTVAKVVQTTWDVAQGIKNSVKPTLPICAWNQKIRHIDEEEAFQKVIHNDIIEQICKYIGFQSLATPMQTLKEYITDIKINGYEAVDVELGTLFDKLDEIKQIFDIDRTNGVDKVFFLTPFITKQLADFDEVFGNYALQVGDILKAKQKIIDYVQQYKDKKEEVINEMLDDIIFNRLYKLNSTGKGVERIQRILNLWVTKYHSTEEDAYVYVNGKYDAHTKELVGYFQEYEGLLVDGLAGKQTLTQLVRFLIGGVEYYKWKN